MHTFLETLFSELPPKGVHVMVMGNRWNDHRTNNVSVIPIEWRRKGLVLRTLGALSVDEYEDHIRLGAFGVGSARKVPPLVEELLNRFKIPVLVEYQKEYPDKRWARYFKVMKTS